MGLGALFHRDSINVSVMTSNSAGQVLTADVYTVTDGLLPSWDSTPYRGAMNLPGAWRAAIIASDLLGSLPWEAFETGPEGVPVIAPDQPAVLLQPAPPDAGITTVSSLGLDYIWHGNAIALKGPLTPEGDVSVIAPVPIGNVAIGRSNGDDGTGLRRGEPVYRVGNRLRRPDELVHLKGPCEPGALRGMGALECHLNGGIRTALELQRQAGNLDISGVPTGTLKVTAPDLEQHEADEIKASWLAAQRNRTVAVLNDVTDFTPLAWNPTEAQLLDARKFSLHELALIIGVPLYFLGVETSNRTYSNVEQEGIVLTRFHLAGAIRRVEAAFTSCMRTGRRVQADLTDALRADTLTRYQAWQIGLTAGFLKPNEVRSWEKLAPVPGGDELVSPDQAEPTGSTADVDTGPPEIAEGEKEQGRSEAVFDELVTYWMHEHDQTHRERGWTLLWEPELRADPTGANLKAYWTVGPGRARWNSWTELYKHLLKYLSSDRARRTAAEWFHLVKGYWPGDKRNRSAADRDEYLELRDFDPSQPRWPAGTPGVGGQWKGDAVPDGGRHGGGGVSVAELLAANTGGTITAGGGGRRRRPAPGSDGSAAGASTVPARQYTNDDMAMDYSETWDSLGEDRQEAVNDYVGWEYGPMNAVLRGQLSRDEAVPETLEAIDRIKDVMGRYRTPAPVVGVRALGGRSLNLPPQGEAVGKVITGSGFQSVSMTTTAKGVDEVSSSDIGRNYRSKPVRLRMVIPPGMPAIVAQGTPNAIASEREILLPHNTRYVVTGDDMEGDKRWLTVTALPPL